MKTVLVIEDRHDLRGNIIEILELENFKVLYSVKPTVGFELAKKHLPDIIIFDIMIEENDVLAFFDLLRSTPQTNSIPVVVLDGISIPEAVMKHIVNQPTVHVNKPFSQEVLIAAVHSALEE